jgi:hypothetical protein
MKRKKKEREIMASKKGRDRKKRENKERNPKGTNKWIICVFRNCYPQNILSILLLVNKNRRW